MFQTKPGRRLRTPRWRTSRDEGWRRERGAPVETPSDAASWKPRSDRRPRQGSSGRMLRSWWPQTLPSEDMTQMVTQTHTPTSNTHTHKLLTWNPVILHTSWRLTSLGPSVSRKPHSFTSSRSCQNVIRASLWKRDVWGTVTWSLALKRRPCRGRCCWDVIGSHTKASLTTRLSQLHSLQSWTTRWQ